MAVELRFGPDPYPFMAEAVATFSESRTAAMERALAAALGQPDMAQQWARTGTQAFGGIANLSAQYASLQAQQPPATMDTEGVAAGGYGYDYTRNFGDLGGGRPYGFSAPPPIDMSIPPAGPVPGYQMPAMIGAYA